MFAWAPSTRVAVFCCKRTMGASSQCNQISRSRKMSSPGRSRSRWACGRESAVGPAQTVNRGQSYRGSPKWTRPCHVSAPGQHLCSHLSIQSGHRDTERQAGNVKQVEATTYRKTLLTSVKELMELVEAWSSDSRAKLHFFQNVTREGWKKQMLNMKSRTGSLISAH